MVVSTWAQACTRRRSITSRRGPASCRWLLGPRRQLHGRLGAGADVAIEGCQALESVVGGIECGAAVVDLAAFVKQPPNELVRADLIFSPLVPQNVMHNWHRISCRVVEDELVALAADGVDEVCGRLGLYAVGEHAVVVVPDAREVDRRPGKVVRAHEAVDEDPAQRLLYVRSWRRLAASAWATAHPCPDFLCAAGIPARGLAHRDVWFGEVRISQPPDADRFGFDVAYGSDVCDSEQLLDHDHTLSL